MSSQGLQILNLVQGCIQIIFWYVWLVRLVRLTPECPPITLAIWSAVLLVFSAVPLSFLIVGLIRTYQSQPHTLWLGLGCTVATFLSNTVMLYETIWCGYQIFKPEYSEYYPHYLLICLSIVGWIASVLAMLMAGFKLLEGGFLLAGLGALCIQVACSSQANGRKAEILLPILTSALLLGGVLIVLGQLLVALSRNNVIIRPLSAATYVWFLSQLGIWCLAAVVYGCGFRGARIQAPDEHHFASPTSENEPWPITTNHRPEAFNSEQSPVVHEDISGRSSSIIILPSMSHEDTKTPWENWNSEGNVFSTYVAPQFNDQQPTSTRGLHGITPASSALLPPVPDQATFLSN